MLRCLCTSIRVNEFAGCLKTRLLFEGTGTVVLRDHGAQTHRHVADTSQMELYNRYCAFGWYYKNVWCHKEYTE